ncbi:amino acid ABC transporter permease [Streptomyces mirabilis]|uniref:Amino acid ABC transporter permease n=1 Tax=Streptomyces mirabilis TaxID=68239 RepID=A0ABU3V589_9ACTN|nr:amino acid ABC transporter permease [Streptomyces mirabilis]MCX5355701.1 amino acid ABC transporter permease [Streptomyces mirabilis]MDU9001344.1 amino acid ABC transporter permease [Streptomyces mirabilis]
MTTAPSQPRVHRPGPGGPPGEAPALREGRPRGGQGEPEHLRLFDVPGPRTRRRVAWATAVSVTLLTVLLGAAVRQFAVHGQLDADKWRLFAQWPVVRYLLLSLWATVQVALVAGAVALPFGALLALARVSGSGLLRQPASWYVEVLRAVPLLLLIYAFLLGLPDAGVRMPLFWQLVCPIVLTNAAVFAEIFRAGIRALPSGQHEAAQALGLTHGQAMRLVVLPQAVRQSSPALVGQLVRLLKDSTLGYVVSYLELLNSAKVLGEYNHTIVQSYLVVALVFVVVNTMLASAADALQRRVGPAAAAPGSR